MCDASFAYCVQLRRSRAPRRVGPQRLWPLPLLGCTRSRRSRRRTRAPPAQTRRTARQCPPGTLRRRPARPAVRRHIATRGMRADVVGVGEVGVPERPQHGGAGLLKVLRASVRPARRRPHNEQRVRMLAECRRFVFSLVEVVARRRDLPRVNVSLRTRAARRAVRPADTRATAPATRPPPEHCLPRSLRRQHTPSANLAAPPQACRTAQTQRRRSSVASCAARRFAPLAACILVRRRRAVRRPRQPPNLADQGRRTPDHHALQRHACHT